MRTKKQRIATTTNWAKARIKGAFSACRWAADNAKISEEAKEALKDASILILNAIEAWKTHP